jgi:hypothetical protein
MAESVKAYFAAVKIQIQESKKQSQAFEDAKKIFGIGVPWTKV